MLLRQVFAERVVPLELVCGGIDEFDTAVVHDEAPALFAVGGLARDENRAVMESTEILSRVSAGVRFLDAVRERALAADGEAARGRRRRSGEHAGREDEHVVRPERIAGGVAFFEENARRERTAAEQVPLLGEGLCGGLQIRHVDAD